MEKKIRIIDKRVKEKFMMDDAYLNGYAKQCGWKATLVYLSLCRHSNKDQFCFPSIELMSKQHSVCRDVIMDGIKILENWNVIAVQRERATRGTWRNNSYTLLDKSVWKHPRCQVAENDSESQVDDSDNPSRHNPPNQVDNSDTKETNTEGYKYKETHIGNASIAGNEINEIFKIFSKINPTLNWKNMTSRKACEELISIFGFEGTKKMAETVVAAQGRPYAPVATTPYEMKEKIAKFKIYFEGQNRNRKGVFQV